VVCRDDSGHELLNPAPTWSDRHRPLDAEPAECAFVRNGDQFIQQLLRIAGRVIEAATDSPASAPAGLRSRTPAGRGRRAPGGLRRHPARDEVLGQVSAAGRWKVSMASAPVTIVALVSAAAWCEKSTWSRRRRERRRVRITHRRH
jgi:hypothetical protein